MARGWQPNRGGHAPGYLRDAFELAVDRGTRDWQTRWYEVLDEESIALSDPAKQQMWNSFSPEERGRWLTGQLWNCTDILPSTYCQTLDLPSGSTYAMAARILKKTM